MIHAAGLSIKDIRTGLLMASGGSKKCGTRLTPRRALLWRHVMIASNRRGVGALCRHHTCCDYLSLNQCICIYSLLHSTKFHTTTPEKKVVFLKTYCCLCELCWALGATNDQVLQVLWILSPPCTRWVSWTGSLWVLRWASKWEPTHLSGRQTGGRKRGWTNSLRTLHQEINQLY